MMHSAIIALLLMGANDYIVISIIMMSEAVSTNFRVEED